MRQTGLLGIFGVVLLALFWFWYRLQWSGTFQFFNDATEWAFLDKMGHFWCTYLLASFIHAWVYGDQPKNYAASLQAFVMVSSIELADAFSVDYGFSIFDVLANGLGTLLAFWAPFKSAPFRLKFSFIPSGLAHIRPEMLGSTLAEQWIKDYNGQTYWISVPLNLGFKKSMLPDWLGISLGYGAHGMLYAPSALNPDFACQWYIGPDILFSRIPVKTPWMKTAFLFLDIVKWPFGFMVWQSGLGWGWGVTS